MIHGASAAKGEVFVQFVDSNDLYRMNLDSNQLTLFLAGPSEPALLEPRYDYMWSGETTAGFVYVYQADPAGPTVDPFVLLDADKDGQVDRWQTMSKLEWDQVLGSPATWKRVFN